MTFLGFIKKLVVFVLFVAIAIPLRYGSINRTYLTLRLLHSALSVKYSLLSDPTRSTLSADYRAFESILQMKSVAEIDPLADPLPMVKQIRENFLFSTLIPQPSQCKIKKEVFEHDGHTIDAYWVNYPVRTIQKPNDKILLYLHGGGYMLGDIYGYSGIECHLSQLFNITILHLEYRLSPEHPLPAAVDDSVAIYHALLRQNILPSQLIMMGDSAGGGLSLLTIQSLIARQLPVPLGVIVLSPWTDLSVAGESYTRNRHTDVMLNTEHTKWAIKLIMGDNHSELSLNNSSISPLFGSFEGFPPLYINVGTAEILEDDSRAVVKKAKEANVDVTFEEGLHMMHVYPLFFLYYPEARNSLDNINKWIETLSNRKLNE